MQSRTNLALSGLSLSSHLNLLTEVCDFSGMARVIIFHTTAMRSGNGVVVLVRWAICHFYSGIGSTSKMCSDQGTPKRELGMVKLHKLHKTQRAIEARNHGRRKQNSICTSF